MPFGLKAGDGEDSGGSVRARRPLWETELRVPPGSQGRGRRMLVLEPQGVGRPWFGHP